VATASSTFITSKNIAQPPLLGVDVLFRIAHI
jgi:hypothetical protein